MENKKKNFLLWAQFYVPFIYNNIKLFNFVRDSLKSNANSFQIKYIIDDCHNSCIHSTVKSSRWEEEGRGSWSWN